MNVERDVLVRATALLQSVREAERVNGWEGGELLRTTLRLLVVAGADGHGWTADELAGEARELVAAVELRNASAVSGVFDCHGMTVTH